MIKRLDDNSWLCTDIIEVGVVDGNNRLFTASSVEVAIKKYMRLPPRTQLGGIYSEHIQPFLLSDMCFIITELYLKDNRLCGEFEILDTPVGVELTRDLEFLVDGIGETKQYSLGLRGQTLQSRLIETESFLVIREFEIETFSFINVDLKHKLCKV